MGIFDSLGSVLGPNIQGAAAPFLTQAYNTTAPYLAQGRSDIATGFGTAIPSVQAGTAAALPYLQSIFNTGQQGTTAYGNLTGATGGGDPAAIQAALAATPGYTFTLGQGLEGIERTQAAGGQLASGATQAAGAKYASGLADQTYQQMVQNLLPYLNMFQGGATGTANAITGGASNVAGLQAGQGQALATQGNVQAQLPWTYGTQQAALGAQQATSNANYGLAGILGLGSLAGSVLSDERLKENIQQIGNTYDGLGIFRYNYLWDDTPRVGLLAQEVEKVAPEAVVNIGEWKALRYDKATDRAAQLARFLEAA